LCAILPAMEGGWVESTRKEEEHDRTTIATHR